MNSVLDTSQVTSIGIDLESLRMTSNFGATFGVKKLLTNVLVGKPKKANFFRTHSDPIMTFTVMILELKETREHYLVLPEVAQVISNLVSPVTIHVAIDRQNNVFLIPVPMPNESGNRNPWHESLAQSVQLAEKKWIRLAANMQTGHYDVFEATGELPEPEWPAYTIETLLQIAFRGKIITSLEHAIVQSLLGKI